ncbi:hypothetical protein HRbin25_00321 [bacterium HR25]|jgi:hypothetical protein|nr:hypothetical protein HRbin25_00321 [bacterium HR25]
MSSVRRLLYRCGQFLGALRPRLRPEELAEVRALLGERLYALFASMSRRDQRHCLDVYRALRDGGCRDSHLLMAALLHDVGKGDSVRLWHRCAYVFLMAAWPSLLGRAGGGLAVLRDHPQRGAELAAAHGAPPEVVELVLRHEGPPGGDARLSLLRAADDSC